MSAGAIFVVLSAAVLGGAAVAHAEEAHPLGIGVAVGIPGEGSGPPVAGHNWPVAVTARWRLPLRPLPVDLSAAAGVGVPLAGEGLSGWLGLQAQREVLALGQGRALAVYACAGLRAGLVGPDYYARHSHVFVGYEYIYSGPWTVAPRLPVGTALALDHRRTEVYLEVIPELPLLPTVELRWGAALGVRLFF
jgi:hypothetical protein